MSNKLARDIMRSTHVCLQADMHLDQVSDHLTKHKMPGAPVVDSEQHVIGFVSEYDCLEKLLQSTYYCDNTALASDVMSVNIIATTPDITLIDLASELNKNKVNVMPVIDHNKILGVICRSDVMHELVNDLEECAVGAA